MKLESSTRENQFILPFKITLNPRDEFSKLKYAKTSKFILVFSIYIFLIGGLLAVMLGLPGYFPHASAVYQLGIFPLFSLFVCILIIALGSIIIKAVFSHKNDDELSFSAVFKALGQSLLSSLILLIPILLFGIAANYIESLVIVAMISIVTYLFCFIPFAFSYIWFGFKYVLQHDIYLSPFQKGIEGIKIKNKLRIAKPEDISNERKKIHLIMIYIILLSSISISVLGMVGVLSNVYSYTILFVIGIPGFLFGFIMGIVRFYKFIGGWFALPILFIIFGIIGLVDGLRNGFGLINNLFLWPVTAWIICGLLGGFVGMVLGLITMVNIIFSPQDYLE